MKVARTSTRGLLPFALVAVLATCGAQPTVAPTATVPPPTDTPEPTAATPLGGSGPSLDEIADPSELSSYRATITMRITGTDAGETVDGSLEFLMEYTSDPLAQHIRMSGRGVEEVESTGTVDMYQLEDTTYVQFGDQWLSIPTTEDIASNMGIIRPDDLLEDTCGWQQQADSRYEGIEAYHWTLSTEDARECMAVEGMAGIGSLTEASGDLYVAKEGNYIVHMRMVLAGSDLEANLGSEEQVLEQGRMEVIFDMRDVNQPFIIEIPEEALASGTLPDDLPIPGDAEELSNAFGMITYKTSQSPAEINDYYRSQLPANGWTEVNAEQMSDLFMLEYTKDGRTLNLTINSDDTGKTSVLIIAEEPES
jgi:hypothetical protein